VQPARIRVRVACSSDELTQLKSHYVISDGFPKKRHITGDPRPVFRTDGVYVCVCSCVCVCVCVCVHVCVWGVSLSLSLEEDLREIFTDSDVGLDQVLYRDDGSGVGGVSLTVGRE